MFDNYIEEGLDDCKFVIDGLEYIAIIEKIGKNHLIVKPLQRTGKGVWETNMDTKFEKLYLPRATFDEIKLELWMDGRGCDNSAIGCFGCYEPYTLLYKETA